VVVRNEATGAEARATTARNGTYRFTGLSSGEYTLEAESPQLGHGSVEGILSARPETPSAFEQPFLVPSIWGQLPQMVVDSRYGFTIGNPSRLGQGSYPDEKLYHAQESVDWVRGSLLVKAGFDLSHNSDATSLLRNQTGTYNYSSVENFASDTLAFAAFGIAGQLNPYNQHNCDQTGKV
jgi:hypothetical protein